MSWDALELEIAAEFGRHDGGAQLRELFSDRRTTGLLHKQNGFSDWSLSQEQLDARLISRLRALKWYRDLLDNPDALAEYRRRRKHYMKIWYQALKADAEKCARAREVSAANKRARARDRLAARRCAQCSGKLTDVRQRKYCSERCRQHAQRAALRSDSSRLERDRAQQAIRRKRHNDRIRSDAQRSAAMQQRRTERQRERMRDPQYRAKRAAQQRRRYWAEKKPAPKEGT